MPAIRTASELGLAIRSRRRELKLDQAELARRVGVTRQWVIDIEKGKPRAELELVMRALHALELTLLVEDPASRQREPGVGITTPDINATVSRFATTSWTSSPSLTETFRQHYIPNKKDV